MRIVLCFVLLAYSAQTQTFLSASKIDAIERIVTGEMSAQHVPGMSVAVWARGEIWTRGYGMADLENFVPAKASTVYRTASVAKPMTAVAALLLVESGMLNLDADIHNYLPEYPKQPWPITMRQLLGHLGGIREYRDGVEASLPKHFANLDEAITVFSSDPLAFEPGTKYLYSTFGFVLAGKVLETVSARSYGQYMQEHVFAPAGMHSTQTDDVYRLIPNRARGYGTTENGEIRNAVLHDTSYKVPGGGLVSTAGDLVRFAAAMDSGKLLHSASIRELFTPQVTRGGQRTGYGMGWGITEKDGRAWRIHTGGQAGVSTALVYLPDHHAAIAMMLNLEGLTLTPLLRQTVQIVLQ